MKCREKLLLSLLVFLLVGMSPSWRLESSSKAAPLGHDAVFVIKTITGPKKVEMQLVFFDEKKCCMQVAVNHSVSMAAPLNEMGAEAKALAVCNGGYFHVDSFTSNGLEIADGKREDEFRPNAGCAGALIVRQGKPSLIWEQEFQDAPDISDLLQCSPWLVEKDKICPVLNPAQDPRSHRTFLLTDGAGHWAIGVCNSIGLHELARVLLTPGIIIEMKVHRALNLDGGPSSGLWCRSSDGREHFEKPGWALRNAIMVVPRETK